MLGRHNVVERARTACERARRGFSRLTLTGPAARRRPAPGPGVLAPAQVGGDGRKRPGLARVRGRRLELGGVPLVQPDATTCGSTVLVALAVLGDPSLGALLVTGRTSSAVAPALEPRAVRTVALTAADGPAPTGPKDGTPPGTSATGSPERVRRQVLRLQGLVNRHALGPTAWPRRLGSPPWAVAAAARWPGVGYRFRAVDDDAPGWPGTVAALRDWLERGVPVPLLVGGDLGRGLTAAVPRHYVLALPWVLVGEGDPGAGCVHVYDPSSGRVHRLDLLAPRPTGTTVLELGGWHRVVGAIWPTASRRV